MKDLSAIGSGDPWKMVSNGKWLISVEWNLIICEVMASRNKCERFDLV